MRAGEVLHIPFECAPQGGSAEGHARRRHLRSAAAGMAEEDGQLSAPVASRVDLGLRGRVALVAAASRGLGRAIAEELREGESVVICARD